MVVSGDERNEYSSSVVVLPTTTDGLENISPIEVFIKNSSKTGLNYPSKILCDSPFTWDKRLRFDKKLGVASKETMKKVKKTWQLLLVEID